MWEVWGWNDHNQYQYHKTIYINVKRHITKSVENDHLMCKIFICQINDCLFWHALQNLSILLVVYMSQVFKSLASVNMHPHKFHYIFHKMSTNLIIVKFLNN